MNEILTTHERTKLRTERRRKAGVKYKLRVVEGTNGLLELVEEQPPRHWLEEWSRVLHITGWGM